MKLLGSSTWEIKDFISDDAIPQYAILSHTWGVEEVTFHDWQNLASTEISLKQGYEKIRFCCNQAVEDGLEWVWIDTCCIDKSSSAELSEAINSMFRWYHNAIVCYAYLEDVSVRIGPSKVETCKKFTRSRWFTRGWTLQELLAPANIIFYSKDWKSLGNKLELVEVLSSITGIEEDFLRGKELGNASISKRMSWAARRNTSRAEDIAYCLIGIFDINMPLIYGEGKKAFQRLQLELMRAYPYDHTLFAWGHVVEKPSLLALNTEVLPSWNQQDSNRRLLGPLAESPCDFKFSGEFVPYSQIKQFYQEKIFGPLQLPTPIGLGVQFALPTVANTSIYFWRQVNITQTRSFLVATLFCLSMQHTNLFVGIPLQHMGHLSCGRTREIILQNLPSGPFPAHGVQQLNVEAEQPTLLENGDIIIQDVVHPKDIIWSEVFFNEFITYSTGTRVFTNTINGECICLLYNSLRPDEKQVDGLGIILRRLPHETLSAGKLAVCVALTRERADPNNISVNQNGGVMVTKKFLVQNTKNIQSFLAAKDSNYHHIMEPPVDSWVLNAEFFPTITVQVKRYPINGRKVESVVDAICLTLSPRDISQFLPIAQSSS